jgi:deoxyribonuclease-4
MIISGALGSHLDRHEHIGRGLIGKSGFELLMKDARFDGMPMVMEVPEGTEPEEMILLYQLERKK